MMTFRSFVAPVLVFVCIALVSVLVLFGSSRLHASHRTSSQTEFDATISLYRNPVTPAEKQPYEDIINHWDDGVCESTNGAMSLGTVRIFRNGRFNNITDIQWNASEGPRGDVSGFGIAGEQIIFGDTFPRNFDSTDPDSLGDADMLTNTQQAGYIMTHEWGHYGLGVFDEYVSGSGGGYKPSSSDTNTAPSAMTFARMAATPFNIPGLIPQGPEPFDWLNHSTPDQYDSTNTNQRAQGRVFGKSGWEVLEQTTHADPVTVPSSGRFQPNRYVRNRIHYAPLEGKSPETGVDTPARETQLPTGCGEDPNIVWMSDTFVVQLVLDRSGSMGPPLAPQSKFDNMKQGAKNLLDMFVPETTDVGIMSYSSDLSQDSSIQTLDGSKASMKTSIDDLPLGGRTALFDAADSALTNLLSYRNSLPDSTVAAVFLLTDGEENFSSTTKSAVLSNYQNAGIPLYTFAYGDGADTPLMEQLARQTAGQFSASPTTLTGITGAFERAKTDATGSHVLHRSTVVVAPGDTEVVSFQVDSTIERYTLFALFDGFAESTDVRLFSGTIPGGDLEIGDVREPVPVECTQLGFESDPRVNCQATAQTVAQNRPENPLLIIDNTLSNAPTSVSLDLLGDAGDTKAYSMTLSARQGQRVEFPRTVVLTGYLTKQLPITDANVTAELERPDGSTRILPMNDEGRNGDEDPDDGIYSAEFIYDQNGVYTATTRVNNDDLRARFTRDRFAPAHTYPFLPGAMHESPPSPPPPIRENFTRVDDYQILAEGVKDDDHPNQPPNGSGITPDNVMVPGCFQGSGDLDVFRVPELAVADGRFVIDGVFETLVIRMTDLNPFMDPKATVFLQGNDFELKPVTSGDFDSNGTPGGYLAFKIPARKIQNVLGTREFSVVTLFVQVENRSLKSPGGCYNVSAGPATHSDKVGPEPVGSFVGSVLDPADTDFSISLTPVRNTPIYVQVNLNGTTAGSGNTFPYTLSTNLLNRGDSVEMPIRLKQREGAVLLGLRSDREALSKPGLPPGLPRSEMGRTAFARTALLVEWSDARGNLFGDTQSTTDVSEFVSHDLIYKLSPSTTRLFRRMGFDVSPGSDDFAFYFAGRWEGAWKRDDSVNVTVEEGSVPGGINIRVQNITRDLPGALGRNVPQGPPGELPPGPPGDLPPGPPGKKPPHGP